MVKSLQMTTKKSNQPALKDGTVTLKITVKKAAISKAYQSVLKASAQDVELKGFRKGRAPLNLVEQSLDKSALYSRVLELVLPPAYSQAVKAGKHLPLVDPQLTPIKMKEGEDWEFDAKLAEAPEVRVGDYRKYIAKALRAAKRPKELKKDKERDWLLQLVFDTLLKHAQVEPSPLLIEHEAHLAIHRLEKQLGELKLNLTDYLKSIKKSEEQFHQEYHQTARTNLALEFVLKAIMEQENISVTPAKLAKANPPKGQEDYVSYLLQKQKLLDILVKL